MYHGLNQVVGRIHHQYRGWHNHRPTHADNLRGGAAFLVSDLLSSHAPLHCGFCSQPTVTLQHRQLLRSEVGFGTLLTPRQNRPHDEIKDWRLDNATIRSWKSR